MENIIGNINSETTENGNIVMQSGGIFCNSFYFQDLYDDKLITKFIKNTEAIIRQSKEYYSYLALIKTNYNILSFDNFQSNISESDASIEIHHYPFTLYEIVEIVMNQHILDNTKFTSFSLAKEIMEMHFKHQIGFVPLCTTNHQLAHDGAIFISEKQIFGNWKEFYKKYESVISDASKDRITKMQELSKANVKSDFNGIF